MKALKEKKAPAENVLLDPAIRWMAMKKREDELSKERKTLGQELLAAMKKGGVLRVKIGDRTVYIESSKKKNVSKANVVEFFGAEKGELFWQGVPDSICEYLAISEKVRK